jgi:cytoskeletal protein CcmA (bactofilin family)
MSVSLDERDFVFIGKSSKFKGDLFISGPGHINGVLTGNIKVETENKLIVEPTGHIQGSIQGHDVDIYGRVDGDVITTGVLCIFPSAQITGKINARSMIIKPGAKINMIGHTFES